MKCSYAKHEMMHIRACNKTLCYNLEKKKMKKGKLKEGQATWEEYRSAVTACRDATRKATVHLQLNLARDVKETRKASSSTSAANGRLEIMWDRC